MDEYNYDFFVLGEPAPQGSKRHVGHGILLEQSKKVKPWREAIKYAFYEKYGTPQPLDGAISLILAFTVKIGRAHVWTPVTL